MDRGKVNLIQWSTESWNGSPFPKNLVWERKPNVFFSVFQKSEIGMACSPLPSVDRRSVMSHRGPGTTIVPASFPNLLPLGSWAKGKRGWFLRKLGPQNFAERKVPLIQRQRVFVGQKGKRGFFSCFWPGPYNYSCLACPIRETPGILRLEWTLGQFSRMPNLQPAGFRIRGSVRCAGPGFGTPPKRFLRACKPAQKPVPPQWQWAKATEQAQRHRTFPLVCFPSVVGPGLPPEP